MRFTRAASDASRLSVLTIGFAEPLTMAQNPAKNVLITFRTPPRAGQPHSFSLHERCLEGVPQLTARQMTRDFAEYQAERSGAERQKVYRYQQGTGEERSPEEALVAIDFGEVVALRPLRGDVGRDALADRSLA